MKEEKKNKKKVIDNRESRCDISGKKTAITRELLDSFKKDVGKYRAETGGMIGSKVGREVIDLYKFDEHSKNSVASFYYDKESMSVVFREWKKKGYITNGFIHSHPIGSTRPSFHDISTALIHMDFFGLDYFMMPIIQSNKKGLYKLYFYVVEINDENIETTLMYVIEAKKDGYEYPAFEAWNEIHPIDMVREYRRRIDNVDERTEVMERIKGDSARNDSSRKPDYIPEDGNVVTKHIADTSKLFSKVETLWPAKVRQKVIVCVGVGGAREFLMNMARNGIENFVIIDHDTVSETNIATQAVYVSEIGFSKVEMVKKELLDINPNANVECVDKFLDDNMTDNEFKSYMDKFNDKKSTDYLILGCTDNFQAQKRAAALALKYKTPYLAAMMYKGGAGAELIFTYPGVTPSCPRCLLRHRYEQYENGFENDVDSSACSYFATSMMNAYKGYIAMMLLAYHDAPGSEYNNMLDEVKDRNFVWIRLSPNIKDLLGINLFDKAFSGIEKYTFMGEPIWVPQTPDGERFGTDNCLLCGGSGDLRSLYNKWIDTRNICSLRSKENENMLTKMIKIKPLYKLRTYESNSFNARV